MGRDTAPVCHQPGPTLGGQLHIVGPCLTLVLTGTAKTCRQMDFGTTVGIPAVLRGTSCLASWNGGGSVSVYVIIHERRGEKRLALVCRGRNRSLMQFFI